jgi:ubiquinone/menaquinone biosynthesis C-methylase UbiE
MSELCHGTIAAGSRSKRQRRLRCRAARLIVIRGNRSRYRGEDQEVWHIALRPSIASDGGSVYIAGMSEAIEFDRDLYRGTAGDYDRFRVPYPQSMIDDLLARVQPSGHGCLLDLACGTGQITFAVSGGFGEVWAVDQEPDMVDVVRKKAAAAGAGHVRTVISAAEKLEAPPQAFELVAVGNAFHRLHRDAVAASAFEWLQPGGSIALLWSPSPWVGDEGWQHAVSAVMEEWKTRLGVQGRAPAGWDRERQERPDTTVLAEAGFQLVGSNRFPTEHEWTVDKLAGFAYSTSVLPRSVLADRADEFEAELSRALGSHTTGGKLRQTIDFAYELASRPAVAR